MTNLYIRGTELNYVDATGSLYSIIGGATTKQTLSTGYVGIFSGSLFYCDAFGKTREITGNSQGIGVGSDASISVFGSKLQWVFGGTSYGIFDYKLVTSISTGSTRQNMPVGFATLFETNGAGLSPTGSGGALVMVTGNSYTLKSDNSYIISSGNLIVKKIASGTNPGYTEASGYAQIGVWDASIGATTGSAFNEYYESMICEITTPNFEINNTEPGWKGFGYWGVSAQDGDHGPTGMYNVLRNLSEIGTGLEVRFPIDMAVQIGPSIGINFPQNLQTGSSTFASGTGVAFTCGVQHEFEIYLKNNSAPTASDGIMRWWLDNVMVGNYTNVKYTDATSSIGFWGRLWDQVWGGTGTQPKTRDDFFYVSNWFGSAKTGEVSTIVSLSRDIIGANGGESITAVCTGVTGSPAVVINVAGVNYPATTTSADSSHVTFTTPSFSGVTGFVTGNVIIGTKTFTNFNYHSSSFGTYGHPTTFPLEIYPNYTTTLGRTGFENGTLMSVDGQLNQEITQSGGNIVSVVTSSVVPPHSGLYCLQQTAVSSAFGDTAYAGSWPQTDIYASSGGKGRWHRWFVRFTSGTLVSTANNGQIKQFLSRTNTSNFVVVAIGPECRDSAQDGPNIVGVNNDEFNYHINDNSSGLGSYGVEPTIIFDTWNEIMIYEFVNNSFTGSAKTWWNGKKIADTDYQNPTNNPYLPLMGSGSSGESRNARFGLVYTQNALTYPITEYIDDIFVGNGYIAPGDV